jgi:hypothetical protein
MHAYPIASGHAGTYAMHVSSSSYEEEDTCAREREREREGEGERVRERSRARDIYIYIYRERERRARTHINTGENPGARKVGRLVRVARKCRQVRPDLRVLIQYK